MGAQAGPKWALAGVVEAPVEPVWQAMLEIEPHLTPPDRQQISHADSPQRFTVTESYARTRLEVDPQQHRIVDQGEWWYRGERLVEPHKRGSLVLYRVYNIAPTSTRWLVPLVVHGFERQMQGRMEQQLQAIGERLHCSAYLLPNQPL